MAVPAALSALGSALTTNVLGITEKATLTIVTGSDSDASGAAGSAAGSVAGAAAGAAGAAAGAAGAAATALGVGTAAASAAVPKTYRMTVQFNPSSISFHASTVDSPFLYLQQKSDSEIPLQGFRPPSISMSVMPCSLVSAPWPPRLLTETEPVPVASPLMRTVSTGESS